MDIETLREHCLAKPGTTEGFPFGETVLVIKVMNKMFALIGLDNSPAAVNLKCDPERAIEFREKHPEIIPGYHMNKQQWNTVDIEGRLEIAFIKNMVDHSYELVVAGLKKAEKEALLLMMNDK